MGEPLPGSGRDAPSTLNINRAVLKLLFLFCIYAKLRFKLLLALDSSIDANYKPAFHTPWVIANLVCRLIEHGEVSFLLPLHNLHHLTAF